MRTRSPFFTPYQLPSKKHKKYDEFILQEHQSNLNGMKYKIQNIGKSLLERKKNPNDPFNKPVYLFRGNTRGFNRKIIPLMSPSSQHALISPKSYYFSKKASLNDLKIPSTMIVKTKSIDFANLKVPIDYLDIMEYKIDDKICKSHYISPFFKGNGIMETGETETNRNTLDFISPPVKDENYKKKNIISNKNRRLRNKSFN